MMCIPSIHNTCDSRAFIEVWQNVFPEFIHRFSATDSSMASSFDVNCTFHVSYSIKASSPHPKDFQRNSIVTKTVIASSIFIFYMFDPLSFLFAALFRGIVSLHPLSMLLWWISYKLRQKKAIFISGMNP